MLRRRRHLEDHSEMSSIFLDLTANHPDPNEFDPFVRSLPVNRTIHFDCAHVNSACTQARFRISKISAGNEPIRIQLNFTVDLALMSNFIRNDEKWFSYLIVKCLQI